MERQFFHASEVGIGRREMHDSSFVCGGYH
jgi:hypothetical protein